VHAASPWVRPWQRGATPEVPEGTGAFGLTLFFISLSVLFLASMVGIVVVHLRVPALGPRVEFPSIGWLSTAALALLSLSVQWGVRAVREDRGSVVRIAMTVAWVVALGFVGLQAVFWSFLLDQTGALAQAVESGIYAYFLLTGLHAAHVGGGIVMQSLVTIRAWRGQYWSLHCGQLRGIALYWHFLAGVWVILLGFLHWIA